MTEYENMSTCYFTDEQNRWIKIKRKNQNENEKKEFDNILIRQSIEKWVHIVEDGGADYGGYNCPLCLYYQNDKWIRCCDCPIRKKTGKIMCQDTPYDIWIRHHQRNHNYRNSEREIHENNDKGELQIESRYTMRTLECERCIDTARMMISFLESLLEPEQDIDVTLEMKIPIWKDGRSEDVKLVSSTKESS